MYEGMRLSTGEKYAVKVIDKEKVAASDREKEALRTEMAILKLVDHPNIISMEEIFESKTHIKIVMRLVNSGDLFDRILKRKRFSEATARLVVWRLLSAVKYLHARSIVHRDIKPENILCGDPDDDADVLIADFGLSKFSNPREVMEMPCGTLAYVAPEVLLLEGYSKEVDLWSVGVILYLLLRGVLPFDGRSKQDIIERTLKGKLSFRHKCWGEISSNAINLIRLLLQKDPKRRIGIHEAIAHPWFDELTDAQKQIYPRSHPLHRKEMTVEQSVPLLVGGLTESSNTLPSVFPGEGGRRVRSGSESHSFDPRVQSPPMTAVAEEKEKQALKQKL